MNNKQIAQELIRIAKTIVAVKFEIGDWISQEVNGFYGKVVGINKNGSPKAVIYSEEFSRKPKLDKSIRNWYPAPVKISESEVPSKIRQKIESVVPRFTASKLVWEDSAEDIAEDVVSRMEMRTMTMHDAFRDIGYGGEHINKTRATDLPDNWISLSRQKRVKTLTKAIEKAMRRSSVQLKKIAMDEWIDDDLKREVKQVASLAKKYAKVNSVKGNRIAMDWGFISLIVEFTYFGYLDDEGEQKDGISIRVVNADTKRPVYLPLEVEPDIDAREMWKSLYKYLEKNL